MEGFRIALLTVCASALLIASQTACGQKIEYLHTDIFGNVVAISDEDGNVIERRVYEPYGLPQTPIQDGPGFTGHDMDGESGLIYMQQRYYDPQIGQFLSPDPMAVDPTTAWNFNRYNYAANNPYLFVDPDGREVRVVWHEVARSGKHHPFIKITPEDQTTFQNHPDFANVDASGRHFATLGAGPSFRGLASDINRPTDAAPHDDPGVLVNIPESYNSETAFIGALFEADRNYTDNADYDTFAAPSDKQRWYIADDGYNSASFVSGVLQAVGAEPPNLPVDTPGYDKPLPIPDRDR